jgi:YVTN family beta-propeller protein
MYSNNRNGNRAGPARGFMALFAITLAMRVGLAAFPAQAQPFAYVANLGTIGTVGTVSVIDTATNKVVATLQVPQGADAVAVTPDGKHVYVASQGANNVSVIDAATNTVLTGPGFPIPVGSVPDAIAITPDGKHAYVANGGTASVSGTTVSVIDTATNAVVATVPVGLEPTGVAVTPDGKHVYVVNAFSNSVSVIDTTTNTVEAATLAVGIFPLAVAVTPDGKHAYVTNTGAIPGPTTGIGPAISGTVSVIDTATNTVESTVIAVGNAPNAVAVTPDGKHVYVPNAGSSNVSVIDTATNTVVATVPVAGGTPAAVAVTPDGKHVYVTNETPVLGTVSVIDTATNTVEPTVITVGTNPGGVGIIPPPRPGWQGISTFNVLKGEVNQQYGYDCPAAYPVAVNGSFAMNAAGQTSQFFLSFNGPRIDIPSFSEWAWHFYWPAGAPAGISILFDVYCVQ